MFGSGWKKGDGTGPLRGTLASVYKRYGGAVKTPQELEIEDVLAQCARQLGKISLPAGKGRAVTLSLHMQDKPGTMMIGHEATLRCNFEIVATTSSRQSKLGGAIYLPKNRDKHMTVVFDDVVQTILKGRKKPIYLSVPAEVANRGKTLAERVGAHAGLLAARVVTEGAPRPVRTHVIELR